MKNKNKIEQSTQSTNSQKTESTMSFSDSINSKKIANTPSDSLAFGKKNYSVMLAGIAVIIAGFFIMTLDKADFGFGFMGLTLGPIIAFVGFLIEFYAILKK